MLADIAEELEIAEAAHPVVVVHEQGRLGARIEIQEPPHLPLEAGHIAGQRVAIEQVPLLALAAGVADHAGGPPHDRDRSVPGALEPPQREQGDQAADVEALGQASSEWII